MQSVGVDRVIEHADVAKATLYRTFGGKEQLVAAYLRVRHDAALTRLAQAIERESEPRARLLAVFDTQAYLDQSQGLRRMPVRQGHGGTIGRPSVQRAADDYRNDVLALLTELAAAGGCRRP